MSRRRLGFTLVELLMVIVVLALLSSLLTVGAISVLSSSREAQAKSIVHRATRVMQDRGSEFNQKLQAIFDADEWLYIKARLKRTAGTEPTMLAIYQGIRDRVNAAVPTEQGRDADLLALVETQRLEFPQTWAEAEWLLHSLGQSITWTVNPETENSEVLFWILSEKSLMNDIESLPATAHKDTDGNGKEELLDAWGGQIRFWRWPTRLNDNPAVAKIMLNPTEQKDPNNPLNLLPGVMVEPEYYSPNLYHAMLIVSPGPDGRHGLGNPADKSTYGYWGKVASEPDSFDDIFVR